MSLSSRSSAGASKPAGGEKRDTEKLPRYSFFKKRKPSSHSKSSVDIEENHCDERNSLGIGNSAPSSNSSSHQHYEQQHAPSFAGSDDTSDSSSHQHYEQQQVSVGISKSSGGTDDAETTTTGDDVAKAPPGKKSSTQKRKPSANSTSLVATSKHKKRKLSEPVSASERPLVTRSEEEKFKSNHGSIHDQGESSSQASPTQRSPPTTVANPTISDRFHVVDSTAIGIETSTARRSPWITSMVLKRRRDDVGQYNASNHLDHSQELIRFVIGNIDQLKDGFGCVIENRRPNKRLKLNAANEYACVKSITKGGFAAKSGFKEGDFFMEFGSSTHPISIQQIKSTLQNNNPIRLPIRLQVARLAPTTITWNKQSFAIPEPQVVPLEVCLQNFYRKSNLPAILNDPNLLYEEKQKLLKVQEIGIDFIKQQYDSSGNLIGWDLEFTSMNDDEPCVYLVICEQYAHDNKFGQSMHGKTRVKRQPHVCACKALDLETVRRRVPEKIVTDINGLNLPGLNYHEDHKQEQDDRIRLLICEMILACSRDCGTRQVFEGFTELPSDDVRKAIRVHDFREKYPDVLNQLRGIPDGGAVVQTTWITLPVEMKRQRKDCKLLEKFLHPSPGDEAVTFYLLSELLGNKYGGYMDAVTSSTRRQQILEVGEKLKGLLAQPVEWIDVDAVDDAMLLLEGENYSHYVKPPKEELADGVKHVMDVMFNQQPSDNLVLSEQCSIETILESVHEDWVRDEVDFENGEDLLPEYPGSLYFANTMSGHGLLTIGSFFVFLASGEHSVAQRLSTAEKFLATLDLFHQSGNISAAAVERVRRLVCSFLMRLRTKEQDKYCEEGFLRARRLFSPMGYYLGAKPGILSMSQALGPIGHLEALSIYKILRDDLFNNLLLVRGLLGGGKDEAQIKAGNPFRGFLDYGKDEAQIEASKQDETQIEASKPPSKIWKCPGTPKCTDEFPAEECCSEDSNPDDVDDFERKAHDVVMVGADTGSHHPLYGRFYCQRCASKMPCRARALLEEKQERRKLMPEEAALLKKLQDQTKQHAEHVQTTRLENLTSSKKRERGKDARRAMDGFVERGTTAKTANSSDSSNNNNNKNSTFLGAVAQIVAAYSNYQFDPSEVDLRFISGTVGRLKSQKKEYSIHFQKLLQAGILTWIKISGSRHIDAVDLNLLLNAFLYEELNRKPMRGTFHCTKEDPKYLKEKYESISSLFMDKNARTNATGWKFKEEHLPSNDAEVLDELQTRKIDIENKWRVVAEKTMKVGKNNSNVPFVDV